MFYEILSFCVLGIFSGFFSGLLGIGGGVFIVPCLSMLFAHLGFDRNLTIKYAIATSLGIMIFTAISSFYAHMKKQNVKVDIFKKIIAGIVIGTIFGAYFDHFIDEKYLRILFGIYLFLISVKMLFDLKEKKQEKKVSWACLFTVGTIIGFKSGVLGVGGGSISVPFFRYLGISIRKAAGTSAGITLIVSIVGSISFILVGKNLTQSREYFFGYVYLPALVSIGFFSLIFANIGARMTQRVSNKALQIIFGVILLSLAFKMLIYDWIFLK